MTDEIESHAIPTLEAFIIDRLAHAEQPIIDSEVKLVLLDRDLIEETPDGMRLTHQGWLAWIHGRPKQPAAEDHSRSWREYKTTIQADGSIVVPATLMEKMRWRPGLWVSLEWTDDGVLVLKARSRATCNGNG